ncbi:9432_t:CDS:2 [Dentiscutata erythropus]|uniref:9432_t:CDS:1 n=1 Tax=Dentiscutata erythropus TaxID=1348616 RepID=A0A9N9CSZ5_9GLOM|nr:9432_t:CDS:2 [Dentiscutata erythropus]
MVNAETALRFYQNSKGDLRYKKFDVNSSYDGGLVLKIFDDDNNNRYKTIYTLFPNGTATYINLDFANKNINISRIFPLTMKYYFLLYDDIVDGNKQVTGMLIDWNSQIIQEQHTTVRNSFDLSTNSTLLTVFSLVDGSFGFITTEVSYDNYTTLNNTSVRTLYLYYSFLSFSTHNISEKFLLYYAKNVNFIYISCSPSHSENGNVCMMTLIESSMQSTVTTYQIDFLSSGSVIKLNIRYMNFFNEAYYILPLFYGGSVITNWNATQPIVNDNQYVSNLTGHIIPLNGNEYKWELNPISRFSRAIINIAKFRNDFGYENPNVISTYPKINDIISPNISYISITFSSQISKSLNNLYIYQINTTTKQNKMRQFYPANSENCTILNNTILCNISQSIINRWGSSYVIVVDNNFVKFASTGEPIYGIAENVWTFNTISQTNPESSSLGAATAIVRLTHNGTKAYDSLSKFEKLIFLDSLLNELIESIPTTPGRLRATNRIQYDPSTSPSQYLLQIVILAPTDHYQVSVSRIISDTRSLIKNMDTSIMSTNSYTKYLDSSYGLKVNRSNVMLLDCLTSNFGGFELLNAPFLNNTKNWIFRGSVVETIIESIPQLIIQVCNIYC